MPDTDDNWQPPRECSQGGCLMWQAQQQIRLLRKQLREAMKRNAELSRKLRAPQPQQTA